MVDTVKPADRQELLRASICHLHAYGWSIPAIAVLFNKAIEDVEHYLRDNLHRWKSPYEWEHWMKLLETKKKKPKPEKAKKKRK